MKKKTKKTEVEKYFSTGPKCAWDINDHDKLKGIWIHTSLEGPSSYKKLEIIGKFFLGAARQLRSISKKLKTDDSTEHSIIQPIHLSLRDSFRTRIL